MSVLHIILILILLLWLAGFGTGVTFGGLVHLLLLIALVLLIVDLIGRIPKNPQ